MNIDKALMDLCEKHDLTSLTIAAHRLQSDVTSSFFAVYAGFRGSDGHTRSKQAIEPTVLASMVSAIHQVNEERTHMPVVPDMEIGEVAL